MAAAHKLVLSDLRSCGMTHLFQVERRLIDLIRWLQRLRDDEISKHVERSVALDLTIGLNGCSKLIGILAVVGVEGIVLNDADRVAITWIAS